MQGADAVHTPGALQIPSARKSAGMMYKKNDIFEPIDMENKSKIKYT
jgi:hypothetical protein